MNELYHHGIKGQKWGVRRFQNKDGSLTAEGKKRISRSERLAAGYQKKYHIDKKSAELYAKKRIRTERILFAAAGVTVAAATAVVVAKHVSDEKDETIKPGQLLKRVAQTPTDSLHDTFYAASSKGDIQKYKGVYGFQLKMAGADRFSKTIVANREVKVAGNKSARKIFKNLYDNDADFRNAVRSTIETNVHGRNRTDMYRRKINYKRAYENFNTSHPVLKTAQWDHFKTAVENAGYGGVKDVNDRKFSGYKARSANILFNTNSSFKVKEVTKLPETGVGKELIKGYGYIFKDKAVDSVLPAAAVATSAGAVYAYSTNTNDSRRSKAR